MGSHSWRRTATGAWLLALLLFSPSVAALDVTLISNTLKGPWGAFADALEARLRDSGTELTQRFDLSAGEPDGQTLDRTELIVAAGYDAAEHALANTRRPVLGALLSCAETERLLRRFPDRRFSAIELDQPAERHLRLIQTLLPEARQAGLLMDNSAPYCRADFSLRYLDTVTLNQEVIPSDYELSEALQRLLAHNDAVLALPDPTLSSPAAARTVLLTAYHYRRPVFAYSRAYVQAGALAAVYSSPSDAANDVADWLAEHRDSVLAGRMPPAPPARHFSVAINAMVARALGIRPIPEGELEQRLQRAEHRG